MGETEQMSATAAMDISEIAHQAEAFKQKLAKLKSQLGQKEFPWYPHDSLSNMGTLNRTLTGRFRTLLGELKDPLVLDIGCADGDLAFFLESLGFRVTAIDHPPTNFNGMRGIRKLKEVLHSNIEIVSADLDARFELPPGRYDVAFFLGTLYHLKNPYYLLELLSQHARFCFLNTRVARFAPDGTDIRKIPVAYLLAQDELNRDWTNYWIFSEAGLKRLLYRTGWEVCNYLTVGDTRRSRPDTLENDERACCLARNRRFTDPGLTVRFLKGWHELEEDAWRWTERCFSVEIPVTEKGAPAVLELNFVYPDALKARPGSLRIKARIQDAPLPEVEYSDAGQQVYRAQVPARLLRKSAVRAEFELNQALPPDAKDLRERGIIVSSVALH